MRLNHASWTYTNFTHYLSQNFLTHLLCDKKLFYSNFPSLFWKNNDKVFLLKGFAGTGKTTIIGTIVTNLWHAQQKFVLMAPTGRAAKVITNYSKSTAFTIHKKIYFPKKQKGGGVSFTLQPE